MNRRRLILLIVRRELRARLLSKAFVIGLAVIVVLIVAISGLNRLLSDDDGLVLGLVGDSRRER